MNNSKENNSSIECLQQNVDKFVAFVNQVLNDNKFIERLDRLLPFDNMANATMNLRLNVIKSIGFSLMRMDIVPALYSLAITLAINSDGEKTRKYSVFIVACKTIKSIQDFVNKKNSETRWKTYV